MPDAMRAAMPNAMPHALPGAPVFRCPTQCTYERNKRNERDASKTPTKNRRLGTAVAPVHNPVFHIQEVTA